MLVRLGADPHYGPVHVFLFVALGVLALLILLMLAATSHDFWLAFLTPPVWKALHMLIYAAYALVVLHLALGALQDQRNPVLAIAVMLCVTTVCGLHVAAGWREQANDALIAPRLPDAAPWVDAAGLDDFTEGRAIVVHLSDAEPVAIFRHKGALSAVSNLCAHQNGPLGEGRIVAGRIACPWHGYQYRLEDGCAPPPFTERIATYRLCLQGRRVLVDPRAKPPGTRVDPLAVPEPVAPRAAEHRPVFFIGWSRRVPPDVRRFAAIGAAAVLGGSALLALALAASIADAASGNFARAAGDRVPRGVPTVAPYPRPGKPGSAPGGR